MVQLPIKKAPFEAFDCLRELVFGWKSSVSRLVQKKNAQFTIVNEQFFFKRNEENELLRQTLFNCL